MSVAMMALLHRHQLAYLTAAAWQDLLQRGWGTQAQACLAHWASHALPLAVTRQAHAPEAAGNGVRLGLAAPARWGRQGLALQVPPNGLAWFSEFPALPQAVDALPRTERTGLLALSRDLVGLGLRAHVYGSLGWQQLTGLTYLHDRSDVDLWMAVDTCEQADAACALLQRCAGSRRLDGEFLLPGGGAVAWREWGAWRSGRSSQILVKTLHGVSLQEAPDQLLAWPSCA